MTGDRSGQRIGIVVTDAYAHEDPDHDTPILLDALRARGVSAEAIVWHDESVDLSAFDLLVIRSPWDYPERTDDFLAWIDRAAALTRVVNTPHTMRWNLDKHYLAELEGAGVRIVPTTFATTSAAAASAIAAHGAAGERVVIKPAVSAGARDTGLFEASDPRAARLAARIIERGDVAMVQPEVRELLGGSREGALRHRRRLHACDREGRPARSGRRLTRRGVPGEPRARSGERARARVRDRGAARRRRHHVRRRTDVRPHRHRRLRRARSVPARGGAVEPALNLHVAPEATAAVVDAILGA
ncbi:ATP-grasp domain-containing protein [Microbacterium lacticum]